MPDDTGLTVSLAEFGLGKYEAQAYVALLSRGTISASDLAYYSGMPRTKVYPVLRRLEKKRLATMTRTKPVMCTAVVPQESFDGMIDEQINKVNAMNSLVEELKTLCSSAKRSRGTKERKYVHIDHSEMLRCTQDMICKAKSDIRIAATAPNLELLSECSAALAAASRKGAKIEIMAPPEAVGTSELHSIARLGSVRISESGQNCMIFDGASVLIAGGKSGDVALFESSEILAGEQTRLFESAWKDALVADALAIMPKAAACEAYCAIMLVRGAGPCSVPGLAESHKMMRMLDDNGIHLKGRKLDDVVSFVDAGMRTACSGSATLDAKTSRILVSSELNSGHSLPWAHIIDEYLASSGTKTRLVYQKRTKRGEQVHIKMG